jgi:addiction module HigA family antidote
MKEGDPLPPIHPGEILREEFLIPMGLTPYALAKAMRLPRTRVERLAREESAISPDMALRLAHVFSTTPELWLNLQSAYALEVARDAQANDRSLDGLPVLIAAE